MWLSTYCLCYVHLILLVKGFSITWRYYEMLVKRHFNTFSVIYERMCDILGLSLILSPTEGPAETYPGWDRPREKRHCDALAVRKRSGGDHGEAEPAVPSQEAPLGAGPAFSVCSGTRWSADRGHFQVRESIECTLVCFMHFSKGKYKVVWQCSARL